MSIRTYHVRWVPGAMDDVLAIADFIGQEDPQAALNAMLAIEERALGADHPTVAASLDYLAQVSRAMGQTREAEALEGRAARIRDVKQ